MDVARVAPNALCFDVHAMQCRSCGAGGCNCVALRSCGAYLICIWNGLHHHCMTSVFDTMRISFGIVFVTICVEICMDLRFD